MGERLDTMRKALANKPAPAAKPANALTKALDVLIGDKKTAEKSKKDAPKGPPPKPKPVPPPRKVLRLPPGSTKTLTWDGSQWKGILVVPDCGESFWFEADYERACFVGLHAMYEAWLRKNTPAEDKS